MKANKRTLILLGTAAIFMVSMIGLYTFLFFAVRNKTESTALLSDKITELSGRESRIASSVSVLRSQDSNIQKLSSYFFKASEIVSFTKKIEALGPLSGTTLVLASLDQGVTEKSVPFLNFQINASGKFADVERLIVLLENFPGRIEWKTIQLSKDSSPTVEVSSDGKPAKVSPVVISSWKLQASLTALNFVNE